MTVEMDTPIMNRRSFLKAATVSAVAAAAAGGGAAVVLRNSATTRIVPPPPAVEAPRLVEAAAESADDLLARLAALKAENVRLQAELQLTQEELAGVRATAGQPDRVAAEALQGDLSAANARIDALTGQLGLLSGLVLLYEELEELDLGQVVAEGLATVDETLDGIMAQVPDVADGLAVGNQALQELQDEIPALESGWMWMQQQAARLDFLYQAVELALARVMETGGALLHLLDAWFESLLKWLPFGMGNKALGIMAALTELLAELPDTLQGLDRQVAEPLDGWLRRDADETGLQRRLIKPVRERALAPASSVLAQVETLEGAYRQRLAQPVAERDAHRQTVREQIAAYRESHQL